MTLKRCSDRRTHTESHKLFGDWGSTKVEVCSPRSTSPGDSDSDVVAEAAFR